MIPDEIYQTYNGAIPDDLRKAIIHGGIEKYCLAFLQTTEQNFSSRFQDILRSICVWRRTKRYQELIQHKMLLMLYVALFQARDLALSAWITLSSNCSPSAAIAPPIRTA